jgi:hypothetical protein
MAPHLGSATSSPWPRSGLIACALLLAAAAPAPAPTAPAQWPDAVLRHPAQPDDSAHELNPLWVGEWRAASGETISITPKTFTFHRATGENQTATWVRHVYAPQWAQDLQAKIAGGEKPDGIGPGEYIGYAPPAVTAADIAHDLDLARAFLKSEKRLDANTARALDALKAAAAGIRKGTYRRVMRYCFDAPNAAADCTPVSLVSYYILDTDRLVRIDLPLVAPEEGTITTFTRTAAHRGK